MAFTTVQGSSSSDATSFIGSAGVDSVNLNNVGTSVWLGAQGANDVISFESSSRSVSGYTLRGGQGQDRLSVSDGATSLSNSFINLNLDNDVMQLLNVSSSTIYGGGGSDTLLTGALSAVRFNSNKGDDTTTIAGATGSSIFGGQGNDTTTLNGDYSSSVVQGDNDNDTLTFSNGSSLSSTTVNGNAGNDTINVNAITSFAASTLFGGQGDDSINAANSAVGVLSSGDAGADNLVGGSNNDSLLGGSGDDNLLGNAGADSLIGGSGDDFFLYNTGDVATGEVIDGGTPGANGDTILVQTSTDFTNLTTATILTAGNIENIRITDTTTGTFIGSQLTGQAINVNGTGAGVSTLDVNVGTATAVDLSTLTFTAVGAGTAFTTGTDIVDIDVTAPVASDITGTTLADNITGNTQADTLRGDGGNDTITGGAGADNIYGGNDNDRIDFSSAAELAADGTVNGNNGTDTIYMDTAAAALTLIAADFLNVTTVENLALSGTGAQDVTLGAATNAAFATGITITTAATATSLDLDGSASTVAVTATGTNNNDTLTGGTVIDSLSGGSGDDTITGGAAADALDGGGGGDDFIYTAFAQGGNVLDGTSGVGLTAGDVITGFITTGDQINIAAVATGTNAAADGDGTAVAFDTDAAAADEGVGVVTVAFNFVAGTSTTGNVIDAIIAGYQGGVAIDNGDTAYFAILDTDGGAVADFYNIFAITNGSGGNLADAALKNAGVTVSLIASTTPGAGIVAGDFIL